MANIELVVKIPRSLYANLSKINHETIAGKRILECVKNGTPLPKGHGDLIDRKELLKQPMDTANYPSNYVKIAPTIVEADKESKNV